MVTGVPPRKQGDIEREVRLELEELRRRGLGGGAIDATAVNLARRLDNSRTSPNAAAMLAKELREQMHELRELLPPRREEDELSRVRRERRESRAAAGRAAAKNLRDP